MTSDDKARGLRRHHGVAVWLVGLIGGFAVGIRSDSILLGILGAIGAVVVAGVAVLERGGDGLVRTVPAAIFRDDQVIAGAAAARLGK